MQSSPLVPVMNSTKTCLALAAALGTLSLIAAILPHPVPPSLPAPHEFQAMSASFTVQLEDDLPPPDDGQILGELRAPGAGESERTPHEATPPKRRKSDRDQTRANALSERIATGGLAMMEETSIGPAPLFHSTPCPSLIPSIVVSSSKPLDGQPWPPGRPVHL